MVNHSWKTYNSLTGFIRLYCLENEGRSGREMFQNSAWEAVVWGTQPFSLVARMTITLTCTQDSNYMSSKTKYKFFQTLVLTGQ